MCRGELPCCPVPKAKEFFNFFFFNEATRRPASLFRHMLHRMHPEFGSLDWLCVRQGEQSSLAALALCAPMAGTAGLWASLPPCLPGEMV